MKVAGRVLLDRDGRRTALKSCSGECAQNRSDERAAVAHLVGMDNDASRVLEYVECRLDHLERDGLPFGRPFGGDDDVLTFDAQDCVETP